MIFRSVFYQPWREPNHGEHYSAILTRQEIQKRPKKTLLLFSFLTRFFFAQNTQTCVFISTRLLGHLSFPAGLLKVSRKRLPPFFITHSPDLHDRPAHDEMLNLILVVMVAMGLPFKNEGLDICCANTEALCSLQHAAKTFIFEPRLGRRQG